MSEESKKDRTRMTKLWVRVVHIYLSLYAFVVILFFGATGLMMNHPDWFAQDEPQFSEIEANVPIELCRQPDRLAIVEHFRKSYQLKGEVTDFQVEDTEFNIVFQHTISGAHVFVDPQTGEARIEKEAREFTGVMATIHTGEHTGTFGKRIIDVSAVLLIISALSGIILWTSLSIRRRTGLIWLASGALLIVIILIRLVG